MLMFTFSRTILETLIVIELGQLGSPVASMLKIEAVSFDIIDTISKTKSKENLIPAAIKQNNLINKYGEIKE
jgi:hypothetical protein